MFMLDFSILKNVVIACLYISWKESLNLGIVSWIWTKIMSLSGKVESRVAENFVLQETLSCLGKSIVSWFRKAQIEFLLLHLKLYSEYILPWKFQKFSQFLWISVIFQSWLNFHTCSVFLLDEAATWDWNLTDLWIESYKYVFWKIIVLWVDFPIV